LPRMGEKSAEKILKQIQAFRRKDQRISIGEALPAVEEIIAALRKETGISNLTAAGSLRRFKETIGDIDLMGATSQPEKVLNAFTHLPQVAEVIGSGGTKASVRLRSGLQVDLRIVDDDSFGSLLQYFTGSKEHNVELRERGIRQGLKLSEYGITVLETGKLEKFIREEDFYKRLGLQYIPPELREARGEIAASERGDIPKLVELADIKGDLHVHSKWSDGHDSIETMATTAKEMGYQYIAITDHSQGLGVARGLTPERLRQQMAEIEELNRKLKGFRIFTGVELDIRADGSLDLPDEILSRLDVVVASIHSAMGQEKPKLMDRLRRALSNPNVDVLAHPTCRLLREREPIDLDIEELFRIALETGTALEVNAMPARLDLRDIHIFRARELGVKLALGTDSHSAAHFQYMRFGMGMARRGWCEPKHLLNTRSAKELARFLGRKGSAA
ncbi:MAG: DNA polymerase/3'-5' exonuclease PolX, partial [Dehalococcoidia bacterium]|nr:DNA polymerase/3'-5' exonuclease PolX [Dehalococcoidia bacterium]